MWYLVDDVPITGGFAMTSLRHSPRSMRGVSLFGFIIIFGILGFVGLIAAKCLPAWTEYFAAVKLARKLENSAETNVARLRRDWDLTSSIDRIESVKGADLQIDVSGGKKSIQFEYEARVHIAANTYLLFTFSSEGITGPGGAAGE
jgi:hypothetical protein